MAGIQRKWCYYHYYHAYNGKYDKNANVFLFLRIEIFASIKKVFIFGISYYMLFSTENLCNIRNGVVGNDHCVVPYKVLYNIFQMVTFFTTPWILNS